MRTIRLPLLLVMAGAGNAWAGSATLETGQGADRQSVQIEYRDAQVRMLVPGQAGSAMLLRDGKAYMITPEAVMDLSGVGRMFASSLQAPAIAPRDLSRFQGLDATGRSETLAGAKGEVFVLRYLDEQGQERREEIVLSKDRRAQELAVSLEHMGTTLAQAMGAQTDPQDAAQAELRAKLGARGVLRYGEHFRIAAFGPDPAASAFELPAAPQQVQMPSLEALGAASAAGEPAAQGAGGVLGKIFGDKAQRQQQRVEQRSEAEVDQATDQAVDNVLDKAFDKLFNR